MLSSVSTNQYTQIRTLLQWVEISRDLYVDITITTDYWQVYHELVCFYWSYFVKFNSHKIISILLKSWQSKIYFPILW